MERFDKETFLDNWETKWLSNLENKAGSGSKAVSYAEEVLQILTHL